MKKTFNPLKLVIGILGLSSVAALVGSISGTVAWYAYTTRALVSYTGTSAQSSAQLQIGIKSLERIPEFERQGSQYKQLLDEPIIENGYYYYFTHLGSGGLPAKIINYYLNGNGYAQSTLEPVSTYSYDGSQPFALKNCPTTNEPGERSDAPTSKYVQIPFAFRVFTTGTNGQANATSVANKKVYLSDVVSQVSGKEYSIGDAIRLYVDRTDNLSDFILNPNSEGNGYTKTGGVLDLSGNGYFDYDNNPSHGDIYLHEYIYGDYTYKDDYGTPQEGTNLLKGYVNQGANDSGYHDINKTNVDTTAEGFDGTTFTAKHRRGTMHLDYSHGEKLEDYVTLGTAFYLGTGSVFPEKDNGSLTGDNYVCKTAESGKNIGSFDLTIYIEGWDHATINQHGNEYFNLGLTFEIGANNSNNNSSSNNS